MIMKGTFGIGSAALHTKAEEKRKESKKEREKSQYFLEHYCMDKESIDALNKELREYNTDLETGRVFTEEDYLPIEMLSSNPNIKDEFGITKYAKIKFKDAEIDYFRSYNDEIKRFDNVYYFTARDKKTHERLQKFIMSEQFNDIIKGKLGRRGTIEFECR